MRQLLALAVLTVAVATGPVRVDPKTGQGSDPGKADWPQFLGPNRDGVYRGPALAESWGQGGPRVVWQKAVGPGFSGPVVAQGRVILFHRLGDSEVVESLDARTGTPQWSYKYPTSYRDDFGFDEGPRAVPVVANGVVYTFGAEGQLHAVDAREGDATLERGHDAALQRRQGILRRRRFAARRGRTGHRQHRRQRGRHRRVRREDRQGAVGRH